MKALEKDRTRRYETATAFALDLRHHLNDEPVSAAAPSLPYLASRYIRRHRTELFVALSVVLLLVAGLVFNSWLYLKAQSAKNEELMAAQDLSTQFSVTRQAMLDMKAGRNRAERLAADARKSETLSKETLRTMQIHRIEDQFRSGLPSRALASLARMIRDAPSDRLVAERLVSVLVERNRPIPLGLPMRHPDPLKSALFSPDGNRILTITQKNEIRIWDAETGKLLSTPMSSPSPIIAEGFSADGSSVLTAHSNRWIQVWDLITGVPTKAQSPATRGSFVEAKFSPDGSLLSTRSPDSPARIFDSLTGQSLAGNFDDIETVRFSPDSDQVLTIHSDRNVRLWARESGDTIGDPVRFDGEWKAVYFTRKSVRILTLTDVDRGTATIWAYNPGEPMIRQDFEFDAELDFAQWSPVGRWVAMVSKESIVTVWDSLSRELVVAPFRHRGRIYAIDFSSDERFLVSTATDQAVRVWNIEAGQEVCDPIENLGMVHDVQFSPDARRLITASSDGIVRIWGIEPRQNGWKVAEAGGLNPAKLDPGNSDLRATGTLVSISEDGGSISISQTADGSTALPRGSPAPNSVEVVDSSFDFSGRRIATLSSGGLVRLWDARSGLPMSEPFPSQAELVAVGFSEDGQTMIAYGADSATFERDATAVPLPVPSWLASLAEAAAGQSIDGQGTNRLVGLGQWLKIREETIARPESGYFETVARRSFALSSDPNDPPHSPPSLANYLEAQLEEGSLESLQEVVTLDSTNTTAHLGLASLLVQRAAQPLGTVSEWNQADIHVRQVVELEPENREAWGIIGRIEAERGQFKEAMEAIHKFRPVALGDLPGWLPDGCQVAIRGDDGSIREVRSLPTSASADPEFFATVLQILAGRGEELAAAGDNQQAVELRRASAVGGFIYNIATGMRNPKRPTEDELRLFAIRPGPHEDKYKRNAQNLASVYSSAVAAGALKKFETAESALEVVKLLVAGVLGSDSYSKTKFQVPNMSDGEMKDAVRYLEWDINILHLYYRSTPNPVSISSERMFSWLCLFNEESIRTLDHEGANLSAGEGLGAWYANLSDEMLEVAVDHCASFFEPASAAKWKAQRMFELSKTQPFEVVATGAMWERRACAQLLMRREAEATASIEQALRNPHPHWIQSRANMR